MVTARPPGARGIDEILAAARGCLLRLTPQQAWRELAEDAVLIDIRPAAQRADQGEVPGSAIVERNHLEWRLDPGCDARLPWITGYDHRIIVICHEGYTSSLAAAALHDLGLRRATDVIGGFRAWTAAGLPSAPAVKPGDEPPSARRIDKSVAARYWRCWPRVLWPPLWPDAAAKAVPRTPLQCLQPKRPWRLRAPRQPEAARTFS